MHPNGNAPSDSMLLDSGRNARFDRAAYSEWLRRLRDVCSERGIVLFHDTAETKADFGVHRLWEELAAQYPNFEFKHAHGLGVLAIGSNVPPKAPASSSG